MLKAVRPMLVCVALAGCLAGPDPSDPADVSDSLFAPDWYLQVVDTPDGHDHRDAKQHENRTTANFEVVSHLPIMSDTYGTMTGDYSCGTTMTHDGRRLSVVSSFTSDVAFYLVDTTDPTKPEKVGEVVMSGIQVYDITMTQDQRFVVIATSPYDAYPDRLPVSPLASAPASLTWRNACGEESLLGPTEEGAYESGLVLVDIQDLNDAHVVDYKPSPVSGGHSLQSYWVKEREILLETVFEFVHEASYYRMWQVSDLPTGPQLELLSIITGVEPDGTVWGASGVPGLHDGFLGVHPVTGRITAYMAAGPTGIRIYDIDDPRNPVLLSLFKDFSMFGDTAPATWYWHSTFSTNELWDDGRHYLFASEECPSHREHMASCAAMILDVTDPEKPTFVGAWAMPADAPWEEVYQFSTHHITVHDGIFYITGWHAGMWAVDVSTPEARRTMPTIGAFVPATISEGQVPGTTYRTAVMGALLDNSITQHIPCVLDADLIDEEGTLLVTDVVTGIYLVKFDRSNPAPAPAPWPLGFNE